MRTVPLTEAETRLSELVEAVEAGEEIVISRHGKAVVRLSLVAEEDERRKQSLEAAEALKAMPRIKLAPGETIKQLIEEGRRY